MNVSLAVLGLGGGELVVVLGAILILFGAKRIPEFARGLGKAMNEFKKASNEVTQELHNAMEQDTYQPKSIPAPEPPVAHDSPVVEHTQNTPPATVPKT
jgi:sec-independent protein translocase protein TatA